MAVDAGLGKLFFQFFQELPKSSFLNGRASVLGSELPVGKALGSVRATDIADSDGVGVVAGAMSADLVKRSAIVD